MVTAPFGSPASELATAGGMAGNATNNTTATYNGTPTNVPYLPPSSLGYSLNGTTGVFSSPGGASFNATGAQVSGNPAPAGFNANTFAQQSTYGTAYNPIKTTSTGQIPPGTTQYYSVNGKTYAPGSLETQPAPSTSSSQIAQNNNSQIQTNISNGVTNTNTGGGSPTGTTGTTTTGNTTGTTAPTNNPPEQQPEGTAGTGTYQLSNGSYYAYDGTNNPPPTGSNFVSGQTNPDLAKFDILSSENASDSAAQIQGLSDASNNFNNAVGQILSGNFPMNPYQTQVVNSMQAVMASTIAMQTQSNTSYTDYITAMGARAGGQYTPAATASSIAGAAAWGANQIAYLGATQGQAIAQVEQGFMKDDYDMVQGAYSSYLQSSQAQATILNNLHSLTLQYQQAAISDNLSIAQLNQGAWQGTTDIYGNPIEYNSKTGQWSYPSNVSGVPNAGNPGANLPGYSDTVAASTPNYGNWQSAVSTAVAGGGGTAKDVAQAMLSINGALQSGNTSAAQATLIGLLQKNGEIDATQSTSYQARQGMTAQLQDVEQSLKTYQAEGGNTNIISGTIQNVLAKLGTVQSGAAAELATKLRLFQTNFAHANYGSRLTQTEINQFQQYMPSISNTNTLNLSNIQGMLSLAADQDEATISTAIGQDNYDALFGSGSSASTSNDVIGSIMSGVNNGTGATATLGLNAGGNGTSGTTSKFNF